MLKTHCGFEIVGDWLKSFLCEYTNPLLSDTVTVPFSQESCSKARNNDPENGSFRYREKEYNNRNLYGRTLIFTVDIK